MKPDVQTFEVDGSTVVLTKAPVRRYDWDHRGKFEQGHPEWGHPREKMLYRIEVDGQEVGLAWKPHGWGKTAWGVDALWDRFGGYEIGLGNPTLHDANHHDRRTVWDLEGVARLAVKLRSERDGWSQRLMTVEEIEAHKVEYAERKAREKVEEEARQAQWAREREERDRKEREQRDELTAGLESINERFNGQLSNLEANAVRFALERLASGRWK